MNNNKDFGLKFSQKVTADMKKFKGQNKTQKKETPRGCNEIDPQGRTLEELKDLPVRSTGDTRKYTDRGLLMKTMAKVNTEELKKQNINIDAEGQVTLHTYCHTKREGDLMPNAMLFTTSEKAKRIALIVFGKKHKISSVKLPISDLYTDGNGDFFFIPENPEQWHQDLITRKLKEGKPVTQKALDSYGLVKPENYKTYEDINKEKKIHNKKASKQDTEDLDKKEDK